MEEMIVPKIDPPADIPATATKMQEKVWEADYNDYVRNPSAWNEASEWENLLFLLHCYQVWNGR